MYILPGTLWLVAAAAFLLLEASTVALVSLWFTAGSLAALAVCILGGPFWLQVLTFLAVSLVLLALLRPMMRKHMKITKTNVDSVIGTEGLVTEAIRNLEAAGAVKLGAVTWTARSTTGADIPEGTKIRVDRVEGVKVFVTTVE